MDRKIEKKRWTWPRIAGLVIGSAAALLLISAIYKESGTSKLNVAGDRILIDTVEHRHFQEFIPVTGVVLPLKTVLLDAVEGGRVEEKMVEEGTMVAAGDPILRLSNADLEAAYINQQAQIVSQINQLRSTTILTEQQNLARKEQALDVMYRLDLLEKRLQRRKALAETESIARVEYEETVDEYEHLQRRQKLLETTIKKDSAYQLLQEEQMASSLDLMERNLAFAKQSLENLIVRAPIAGQLSGLSLEIGELVSQGENIAQIDDQSRFKIRASVDQFYISRVYLEQEGAFEFGGQTYRLRIKKIYPQVQNGSFAVDMVFLDELPVSIKRGQSVTIKLELSAEEEALLLGRGGFYQSTGGNWVYVIDPASGRAFKREVRIGRQNPSAYEILSGLQAGEVVITSSYETFGEKEELVIQ